MNMSALPGGSIHISGRGGDFSSPVRQVMLAGANKRQGGAGGLDVFFPPFVIGCGERGATNISCQVTCCLNAT